ncbi:MAG: single-stranded-DNA-specific exonuclease RecJ [Gammaproteobacteria bacterium]|nr:single-stranded-DNA-specific exonuclease RecJ [Gammaproteobacteria bacterium]
MTSNPNSQPSRLVRRTVPTHALPATLHPVLQRVLAARGVVDAAALELSMAGLLRTDQLGGIDSAVALLVEALQAEEKIVFVADFDADGATSCALGVRALIACGATQVDYVVPNRFEYGYGLTPPIVELVVARGANLIVTVDNGISSVQGVAVARSAGLKVLITDHHLPGAKLPQANAIVNPNMAGDEFPSKALAGVGVIFYVMLALRAELRRIGWFAEKGRSDPNFGELLDLVALGTVADVVPLDANNRRLVAQGLARIRSGRCQAGIAALLKVAGRDPKRLLASDLAFAIGPRLNAAGRLADMSLGIECLLSDDPPRALAMAGELDSLNQQRRDIERDMKLQALDLLAQDRLDGKPLAYGLCLFDPTWHQGIIGVVAGRIKELYHRPVVAFALTGVDELKGSARSIPGAHVRDILDTIAATHPDLLSRFGGHAMAAGLSLRAQDLPRFELAFNEAIARHVDASAFESWIYTDGDIPPEDMNLGLARVLSEAMPWGQAFPEPLFEGEFEIHERRVVGNDHLRLLLGFKTASQKIAAIAFNAASAPWATATTIRAAYRLAVNEYQGRETVQLQIEHAELVSG